MAMPKKKTPLIDEFVQTRPTRIPCWLCRSDAPPDPACELCRGVGSVTKEMAREWRKAHPLPPMKLPPKK